MKSALITGATGAIGMALIDVLYQNNVNIYTVCRSNSLRLDRLIGNNKSKIIKCSLSELENLPQLINEKTDVFFHLAWENTIGATARNDMPSQIKNIEYTINAVNVAKKLGCHTFIGAGSQAEYGRSDVNLTHNTPTFPENGYGMAKLCAGQMSRIEAEKLEIKHIWTRILSVYGPFDGENTFIMSAISKLLAGENFFCTKCEQIWDYIYARDIANAFFLLAEYGVHGTTYPIGSGVALPLKQYIEKIRDIINPNIEIGFGDIPYSDNQVMHLCADIENLKRDTNFVPQISFEEGIGETINWVKENKHE